MIHMRMFYFCRYYLEGLDESVPPEEEQEEEVEDGMMGYDEPLSENQLGYTFNEGGGLPVEGPYGG